MTSILSFKDRGPWGSSKWRGNCSGHIYRELFTSMKPTLFVDPMVGSGTSVDVAQEMGIEAVGLDLHQGFDALTMSILEKVGRPASMCVSHPPYGGMVKYSGKGNMWGDEPHPNDLSWAESDEDFHHRVHPSSCAGRSRDHAPTDRPPERDANGHPSGRTRRRGAGPHRCSIACARAAG